MLDSYEISELERRWNEYNSKKNKILYSGGIGIIALILVFLVYFFISKSFFSSEKGSDVANVNSNKQSEINSDANVVVANQTNGNSNVIAQQNQNDKIEYVIPQYNSKQLKKTSSLIVLSDGSLIKDPEYLNDKTAVLELVEPAEEIPMDKYVVVKKQKPQQQTRELDDLVINDSGETLADIDFDKIDDLYKKTSVKQNSRNNQQKKAIISSDPIEKPKSSIDIVSKEIGNETDELKSRFDSTGNVRYAILLAQRYYDNKDYVNAEKWSYTANMIDKNIQESWIIFAKSKYKMGKKNDAIKVLEALNVKHPSKSIESLIVQIQMETL